MHGNLGRLVATAVRQVTIVGVDVARLPPGEKLTVIWLLLMASVPTGGNLARITRRWAAWSFPTLPVDPGVAAPQPASDVPRAGHAGSSF
jgi:hypothetical protein